MLNQLLILIWPVSKALLLSKMLLSPKVYGGSLKRLQVYRVLQMGKPVTTGCWIRNSEHRMHLGLWQWLGFSLLILHLPAHESRLWHCIRLSMYDSFPSLSEYFFSPWFFCLSQIVLIVLIIMASNCGQFFFFLLYLLISFRGFLSIVFSWTNFYFYSTCPLDLNNLLKI